MIYRNSDIDLAAMSNRPLSDWTYSERSKIAAIGKQKCGLHRYEVPGNANCPCAGCGVIAGTCNQNSCPKRREVAKITILDCLKCREHIQTIDFAITLQYGAR